MKSLNKFFPSFNLFFFPFHLTAGKLSFFSSFLHSFISFSSFYNFYFLQGRPYRSIDTREIRPLKPGNVWLYKIEKPTWMNGATLKMEITGTMVISYQGQNYTVAKMMFYDVG